MRRELKNILKDEKARELGKGLEETFYIKGRNKYFKAFNVEFNKYLEEYKEQINRTHNALQQ
jgi:hypothetical protein